MRRSTTKSPQTPDDQVTIELGHYTCVIDRKERTITIGEYITVPRSKIDEIISLMDEKPDTPAEERGKEEQSPDTQPDISPAPAEDNGENAGSNLEEQSSETQADEKPESEVKEETQE